MKIIFLSQEKRSPKSQFIDMFIDLLPVQTKIASSILTDQGNVIGNGTYISRGKKQEDMSSSLFLVGNLHSSPKCRSSISNI